MKYSRTLRLRKKTRALYTKSLLEGIAVWWEAEISQRRPVPLASPSVARTEYQRDAAKKIISALGTDDSSVTHRCLDITAPTCYFIVMTNTCIRIRINYLIKYLLN